ncbi:MAG: hypothetical protein ACRDDY_03735 [Clostridium sp.]|uniref:hypothetical protein n=1 Tax=Clostridium sp. TaxID=1506 RepID=UPI003EE60F4F
MILYLNLNYKELVKIKKLLLLGALLSVTTLANVEETMNVRARVLDTLTVRIDEHVNFGNIAKGSSYDRKGKYSIKGNVGETVAIGFMGIGENGELEMKGVDGVSSITAVVENYQTHTMRLDSDDFVSAEPIKISLDVPSDTKSQEYIGNILIKARYQ